MSEEERIDPGHNSIRDFCRVGGPVCLVIAFVLIATAFINFFMAFGGSEPPRLFWCFFLAMPFFIAGGAMTNFGYMGKVARYVAGETAPVAKDTINYMVDGTQDSIKKVASAIGQGFSEANIGGGGGTKVKCHKCNELVDADSRFCSECGSALDKVKTCSQCGELNDPDAKFCDNCGNSY
ncbi:MAG: zinc ribbon domain-containing protein [Anaerohalosphaera sp.]|nr:zinc ribbon domain-containing protein [Anaerohalosphaera sp.]